MIENINSSGEQINQKTNKEFDDVNNLTKDFVFYKREMINVLDLYQTQYLEKIDATLETKFGKDFFKEDFTACSFALNFSCRCPTSVVTPNHLVSSGITDV